jgi:ABC-type lipoprotein export system ATPase subunit
MVTHDSASAAFGDRLIHIRDGLVEAEETLRGRDAVPVRNA